MDPLHTPTDALLQAAGELEAAVRRTGGWSTEAADLTLDAIDVLLASLSRIGPQARDILVPVQDRLAGLQSLLLKQEQTRQQQPAQHPPAAAPGRRVPRGAPVPRPGDTPEDWITREPWHSEKVFLMLHRPGAAQEWARLGRIFDALPAKEQRAATRRVATTGECWAMVLEGPKSPRPELTAMPVRP